MKMCMAHLMLFVDGDTEYKFETGRPTSREIIVRNINRLLTNLLNKS